MDILIVDRHTLFRQGLSSLLNGHPGFQVMGETDSSHCMVEMAFKLQPGVILFGMDKTEGEDLLAIREITRGDLTNSQVIVISDELTYDLVMASIQAGVRGLLPRNIAFASLIAALNAVERGEFALPRKITGWLVDELLRVKTKSTMNLIDPADERLGTLTTRELEVLEQLCLGVTNREIAGCLFIAENTVRVHVHNILEKLDLKNRHEAKIFAGR